jgi:hypothetical protein
MFGKVNAEPDCVAVDELTKLALVAVTETVAEAPALNPLTVTVEVDLLTEPAVVESVYPLAPSKLVIVNENPPTTEVAVPKVGVANWLNEVPVTVPEADSNPLRVAVTVTVEEAALPKPDCVIVLVEIETEPAVVVAE